MLIALIRVSLKADIQRMKINGVADKDQHPNACLQIKQCII